MKRQYCHGCTLTDCLSSGTHISSLNTLSAVSSQRVSKNYAPQLVCTCIMHVAVLHSQSPYIISLSHACIHMHTHTHLLSLMHSLTHPLTPSLTHPHSHSLPSSPSPGSGGDRSGGLEQMRRFRQFISGTEGEGSCQLWLDIQLVLQQLHNGQLQERELSPVISRIRRCYISDSALPSIPSKVRRKLQRYLCSLHHSNTVVSDGSQHCSRYIQTLCKVQRELLASLRNYWCRLFDGAVRYHGSSIWVKVEREQNVIIETRERSSRDGLPTIVLKGSGQELSCKSVTPSLKLPQIKKEETLFISSSEKLVGVSSLETNPLFTPSTADLLSPSSRNLSSLFKEPYFSCVSPYLTGSLRADFLAGHPLLSHLSCRQPHSTETVNYLLFWWSAELILTHDEMRRFQKLSDRMCGWGHLSFTGQLVPTASDPKELVRLFLMRGAPHLIELPAQMREDLVRFLPRGLGQSMLVSAQEIAAQVSECV